MEGMHVPPVATDRDQSRQDATPLATDFVLTIEQVADRYAKAGHPRTQDELAKSLQADFERIGAILKSINFKPE